LRSRERPASARAASGLRLEAAAVVLRASCEAGEAPCSEAARLVDSDADIEAMRQRLLGCVAESGWRDAEMLRRLALMLERELPGLEAFVIDDTGFPKKGVHSVGVARQYSGTLGRVDNCQVATSLHLAGDWGSACIGLDLYLSEQWTADDARRAKVGIPKQVEFRRKRQIALAQNRRGTPVGSSQTRRAGGCWLWRLYRVPRRRGIARPRLRCRCQQYGRRVATGK
jgi:hypothetical protein